MPISDKTRKLLWGKSGNRCAICKITLTHADSEENSDYVMGEECHIISSKSSGPRFQEVANYGLYENLILLCPNHHSLIDKQVAKYSAEELRKIKSTHEKWIDDNLSKKNKSEDEISHLARLTTGREIVDLITNSHAYDFNYDEIQTQEQCEYISSLLQEFTEYGECAREVEMRERVEAGFRFNQHLEELDKIGFWIFGARRKSKIHNSLLDVATLRIIKKDNSEIITLDPKLVNAINNALKAAKTEY